MTKDRSRVLISYFFVNADDTSKIRDGDGGNRRDKICHTQIKKNNISPRLQLLFNRFRLRLSIKSIFMNYADSPIKCVHENSYVKASRHAFFFFFFSFSFLGGGRHHGHR